MIQYSVKSITFPQLNAKAVQIPVPKSWIRGINYEHGVEGFIFIWNLPLGTGVVSNTCAWLLGIFNYLPASFQTPGLPPLSPWQHPCCQHPVCFCLCSGHLETLLRSLNNKKIIEMYRKANAKGYSFSPSPSQHVGEGSWPCGRCLWGAKRRLGKYVTGCWQLRSSWSTYGSWYLAAVAVSTAWSWAGWICDGKRPPTAAVPKRCPGPFAQSAGPSRFPLPSPDQTARLDKLLLGPWKVT